MCCHQWHAVQGEQRESATTPPQPHLKNWNFKGLHFPFYPLIVYKPRIVYNPLVNWCYHWATSYTLLTLLSVLLKNYNSFYSCHFLPDNYKNREAYKRQLFSWELGQRSAQRTIFYHWKLCSSVCVQLLLYLFYSQLQVLQFLQG